MTAASCQFRFEREGHRYFMDGEEIPHITSMLEAAGWVETTFMTDEGRRRGSAVHDLCAHFDLEGLHVESCTSPYRGYLLGHVKAMSILRPEILSVEEPLVSVHRPRFGGRPDRVWRLTGAISVPEIKSGPHDKSHGIQTALQAILVGPTVHLPPEAIDRYGLYLQRNGAFKLTPFRERRDFDEARRILREYCR